jgi:hypothetical protein
VVIGDVIRLVDHVGRVLTAACCAYEILALASRRPTVSTFCRHRRSVAIGLTAAWVAHVTLPPLDHWYS